MSIGANIIKNVMRATRTVLDKPTFTFRNQTIACIPSTSERGIEIAIGGNVGTIEFSLIVNVDDFPNARTSDQSTITVDASTLTADAFPGAPDVGNTLIQSARSYRVLRVSKSADGSHWILDCGSVN